MVAKVVVWDKLASTSLQLAYDYIKEDSPTKADKFRREILRAVDSLQDHPEKCPPDKYKKDKTQKYRAFEKNSYRVTYKITQKEIIILRIRHVKQEPKDY